MNILNTFKNFIKDEDGAVTVDWVVLTSAIVGLAIAVLVSVSGGVLNLSDDIDQALSGTTIASY